VAHGHDVMVFFNMTATETTDNERDEQTDEQPQEGGLGYWASKRSQVNYVVVEDGDDIPRHAEILHTEHISPHERQANVHECGLAIWYLTAPDVGDGQ
jgi:hypothetical protein